MSREQPVRHGLPGVPATADRRFRRADATGERRRRAGRTIRRMVRWGLPVLLLGGLLFWAGSAVMQSSLLRVRQVAVEGNTHLSEAEVEVLLEGIRSENLLRADLAAYRLKLLDSPWVADARLSRTLPATVRVRVVERTPMAVARLSAQLYLVDNLGVVIDEHRTQYAQFDLPIVDGLLVIPKGGEPTVPPDRAMLTAGLLRALSTRSDLRRRVSQIDVSSPRDAAVMFDDDPVWLHLGDTRFVERLQNYIDLRSTLQDRFEQIDYVDLRFDERVYLRAPVRRGATPVSARLR